MMKISNVAIIGSGTMGYSLAVSFAAGGCNVFLVDSRKEALLRAEVMIKNAFGALSEAGKMTTEESQKAIGRIVTTVELSEAVGSADLALETAYEDPEVKRQIFSELERLCPPHTIFASNTSWLNIFEVAKEVKRQDKLLITHWFSPPHIMPLVEVARSEKTSSETVETVVELYKRIGKKVLVMKKFTPGCFINHLQYVVSNEIFRFIDEGYVNPEDVDPALKASLAIRWSVTGYIQGMDFIGLDQVLRARAHSAIKAPIKGLGEMVAQGKWGVKTGEGFYDYSGKSIDEWFDQRDASFLKVVNTVEGLSPIGKALVRK